MVTTYTTHDKKYTFRAYGKEGIISITRDGEPWLELNVSDTEGYNAILQLICDAEHMDRGLQNLIDNMWEY